MTMSFMYVSVDGFVAASRFESLSELPMMIIPNCLLWMLKVENNFNLGILQYMSNAALQI